jgi:Kef-type K+ transport system membrane component KefB
MNIAGAGALSEHAISLFFVQLALLYLAARLVGGTFKLLGQPAIVGELLGGLLLGPTFLGRVAPDLFARLFPPEPVTRGLLESQVWLSASFLLLLAGMEVDLGAMRRLRGAALRTSLLSLVLPLGAGVLLGLALPGGHAPGAGGSTRLALYLGLAFAISAIPVISRILLDLGMMRTTAGTVILAAGFLDDFVALIGLSLLLHSGPAGAAFPWASLQGPLLAAVFYAAALLVGRPLIQAFLRRSDRWIEWPGTFVSFAFLLAMAFAAVMGLLGVHVIFGAFLAGVCLSGHERLQAEAQPMIEPFVLAVFGPLFFGSLGLRTDLGAGFDLGLVSLVLVVACASKFGGAWLGARWGGRPPREATMIGIGLNARGMVGLVVALIGRQSGVLSEGLYGALLLLAFLTSAAAGPLLRLASGGGGGSPRSSTGGAPS